MVLSEMAVTMSSGPKNWCGMNPELLIFEPRRPVSWTFLCFLLISLLKQITQVAYSLNEEFLEKLSCYLAICGSQREWGFSLQSQWRISRGPVTYLLFFGNVRTPYSKTLFGEIYWSRQKIIQSENNDVHRFRHIFDDFLYVSPIFDVCLMFVRFVDVVPQTAFCCKGFLRFRKKGDRSRDLGKFFIKTVSYPWAPAYC